ncbi:hypothetical protein EVAR_84780_1 [Eumeta japonica]|uniref:Uncharacterized protein n=1 Tax=Eumeta variegata TaxID=151549 RepID=A0A4C1U818_EUMVA|nr:hypothetical protein EVAR_84780_1 [Eumeta japonica]
MSSEMKEFISALAQRPVLADSHGLSIRGRDATRRGHISTARRYAVFVYNSEDRRRKHIKYSTNGGATLHSSRTRFKLAPTYRGAAGRRAGMRSRR